MADVQIAVIDPEDTQLALAAPAEAVVNVAVPGVQGPIGLTGSVAIAQAGTAATPGIRFESDTNTGIYSPGADQLAISTGGTGRLFIDSSGRVGIGTSSPDALLHVATASGTASELRIATGGVSSTATLRIGQVGAIFWDQQITTTSGNYLLKIDGGGDAYRVERAGSAVNTHIFSTAGSERARIDSSGRLLVGTSSAFEVASGFSNTNQQVVGNDAASFLRYSADSSHETLWFCKSRNATLGQHTVLQSGDGITRFNFQASDGTKFVTAARIDAEVDGTPGANDMPGRLVFSTTADGAASPTERLRITSAGLVGIGTSSPAYKIDVAGQGRFDHTAVDAVLFARGGTLVGDIGGSSGGGTFSIRSQTAVPLVFSIALSEAARIDSSGRLLVGTSSGVGLGDSANALVQVRANSLSSTGAGLFSIQRGLAAASIATGNRLGALLFADNGGNEFASITCDADANAGASDFPGRLVFSTTADGAASPTERLRITSAGVLQVADAGNITVGTTTGTKIGTATTQKIGFFDKTPVVQPTAVADATDAASVITQLNALLTRMRNLGLIAT